MPRRTGRWRSTSGSSSRTSARSGRIRSIWRAATLPRTPTASRRSAAMESISMGTWAGLIALGAFHGVNPGMGWLFAVARGMQEGRRTAVWRALLPLGLGHALAVAAAILTAAALGRALPVEALRWGVAAFLTALGVRRLV